MGTARPGRWSGLPVRAVAAPRFGLGTRQRASATAQGKVRSDFVRWGAVHCAFWRATQHRLIVQRGQGDMRSWGTIDHALPEERGTRRTPIAKPGTGRAADEETSGHGRILVVEDDFFVSIEME